jgi:HEAT repeat protein
VTATLRARLSAEDPETRRLAVRDVVGLDAREAGALLLVALGDEDWRVRKEAAAAARGVSDRATVATMLTRAFDDKTNIGLRNAAVEALAALGTDAVPAATGALARLDPDGRKLAVEALGRVADPPAIEALIRSLSDDDVNVRVAAIEALGSAAAGGDESRARAIDGLVGALAARETWIALAALEALGALDARLPWKVLAPFTGDPLVRKQVVRLAADSPDREADDALAEAIAGSHAGIAREAALGLASRVEHDRQRVQPVRMMLRAAGASERVRLLFAEGDDQARAAATVLLGVMGQEEDIPSLIDALLDPDLEQRGELALSFYGDAIIAPLLAHATSAPAPHRASVLPIALSLAPESHQLIDAARHSLDDPAPEVVASALKVLATRGNAADITAVATRASNPDARVAAAAAAALQSIATRHTEASRTLLATIEHDGPLAIAGCHLVQAIGGDAAWAARVLAVGDARTRRAAVEALSTLPDVAARDAVALALTDEDRDVQLAAVRGLGKMGHSEALAALLLAAPRDGELVAAALRALGEIDPDRAEIVAFPLVEAADPAVACAAVDALARFGGSRREDGLLAALRHADPGVVTLAISELALAPTTRATARLGTCLDHTSWEVRRHVAETLGNMGTQAADELLRARLDREEDPAVRDALQWALSARGTPD